jgi:signal transduction histidine kinase
MKEMLVLIDGDAKIWGNAVQIETVFYQMLNNSYDAIIRELDIFKTGEAKRSYQGRIEIKINQDSLAGKVYIHVRDNGAGMSQRVQTELFTPLFTTKGHSERREKRLQEGSGIGMYLILKIIKAHGGAIEIYGTREHEGTDFLVTLKAHF